MQTTSGGSPVVCFDLAMASNTEGIVPVETTTVDDEERQIIDNFMLETCKCHRGDDGKPCIMFFPREYIEMKRNESHSLTSECLDMVVLGSLSAHRRYPAFAQYYAKLRGHKTPEPHDSFRATTKYFVNDLQVCETTFCFLYTLSKKRLQNIISHFDQQGLTERTHGLTGKVAPHSLSPEIIEDVVTFIKSIGEKKGLSLPGRLASVNLLSGMKLPPDVTKASLHREYQEAYLKMGKTPVGLSSFKNIWLRYTPEISILKPQSDMCDRCQINNTSILKSGGLTDDIKEERYKDALEHLRKAEVQRNHYNDQCRQAREEREKGTPLHVRTLSFDYAQNISYPSSASQVGPAYFKTARKCGIFGILCEGSKVQTNFLIDECDTIGKGANTVISMLHYYLEDDRTPELMLHADNCTGQNKNNAVIHYLMWRVITRRNDKIELSFMMPGHTKFGPDRMFGIIKKKYFHSTVDTLDDIVSLVDSSSFNQLNKAIPTFDYVRGVRHIVWRDWTKFLQPFFKPIQAILQKQHFSVTMDLPGIVLTKMAADADSETSNLQKATLNDILNASLPPIINPKGMDVKRQKYLYEQVSGLCTSTLAASLTCPKPSITQNRKRSAEE